MNLFSLFYVLLLLLLRRISASYARPTFTDSLFPSDAVSLLSFKSSADLDNKLLYSLTERFDYCQWRGVKCAQGRVVRLALNGAGLRGSLAPNSLSRLDQLRVLSLEDNSLSGPVPDLSSLANLKSLFLSRNSFSGTFPLSILSLHRLTALDLSFNNFSGPIPVHITGLDRLYSLKLQFNLFNGTVPPLNQSFLVLFNVSGNYLSGPVPVTETLSRFGASSFGWNPGLCGEIIIRACASRAPFFQSPNATSSSQTQPRQSAQAHNGSGVVVLTPASLWKKNKGGGLVMAFTIGVAALIALGLGLVVFFLAIKKRRKDRDEDEINNDRRPKSSESAQIHNPEIPNASSSHLNFETQNKEPKKEDSRIEISEQQKRAPRSGDMVFCRGGDGESGQLVFTLEQLMRASAELLGRGSIGTTYKAVQDNQLIVTVKRLEGTKTEATSSEAFEKHMNMVGELRHPNLVPVRAYFQAKGQRLVIYDYQPNGSLHNLIHGSRSSRAKPLHWTSCLKIADDVAQGLWYIHQTSTLIHGNLKSTNILLGPDFEARLTDYSLDIFSDTSIPSAYKSQEARNSPRVATDKSDVYSFGVLLFELLTGKDPSQHPFMAAGDMFDWVRAVRDDAAGLGDDRLGMIVQVACFCRVESPEERPEMRRVVEMIHEIKESVAAEDDYGGFEYS